MSNKAIQVVQIVERGALTAIAIAATLVMFGNTVGRYVLGQSLTSAEEIVRILFVWSMFIAISAGFVRNNHIGFAVITEKYPAVRFFARYIHQIALVIVGYLVVTRGWVYMGRVGSVPLAGTGLPTGILFLPGVVSGGFWVALGAIRLFMLVRQDIWGTTKGAEL